MKLTRSWQIILWTETEVGKTCHFYPEHRASLHDLRSHHLHAVRLYFLLWLHFHTEGQII